MTHAGKVYVAPLGTVDWEGKGWTELGYTTDDGLTVEAAEEDIPVPSLAGLGEAFKAVTSVFTLTAEQLRAAMSTAGYLFFADLDPYRHQRARLSRMRSAYRRKRGRRRFR